MGLVENIDAAGGTFGGGIKLDDMLDAESRLKLVPHVRS